MKKNNATNPPVANPKIERFRKERTILIALQLPKELHDQNMRYLARRAGLPERYEGG